jgi:hypothetical protein
MNINIQQIRNGARYTTHYSEIHIQLNGMTFLLMESEGNVYFVHNWKGDTVIRKDSIGNWHNENEVMLFVKKLIMLDKGIDIREEFDIRKIWDLYPIPTSFEEELER